MLMKTDDPLFMKDASTGAFINTDNDSYKKFLAARDQAIKSNDLCKRMSALEFDLTEIKNLLLNMVHRNS